MRRNIRQEEWVAHNETFKRPIENSVAVRDTQGRKVKTTEKNRSKTTREAHGREETGTNILHEILLRFGVKVQLHYRSKGDLASGGEDE